MHELGDHTPGPPRPRKLTTQVNGEFVHVIYTKERLCVTCGEPALASAKVKRVAYIIQTVQVPRIIELPPAGRKLARVLLRKWTSSTEWAPLKGVYSQLAPLAVWEIEPILHDLCRTGAVQLKLHGENTTLTHFCVLDIEKLAEHAEPGGKQRLEAARAQALAMLGSTQGEPAARVRELLNSQSRDSWPPEAILAAAAVARHAATERTLPTRVVSTLLLGGRIQETSASKGIERFADRLETFFGQSLVDLGLRPSEPLVTIGGRGILNDTPPCDLTHHRPFLEFPATRLARVDSIDFPPDGLVFIENRNVFETASFDEISDLRGSLLVYTGGMVGPTEEWFARAASAAGSRVRCWFDMDGEGILAARFIHEWTNGQCEPYRMDSEEFHRALRSERLDGGKLTTAKRLAAGGGFLSDLAALLVSEGRWVEQEALLLDLQPGKSYSHH